MKKLLKKIRNKTVAVSAATGAAVVLASGQASAALPSEVETQMSTAQTDGAALAGLALGVFVAIAAVKWVRRGL